MAESIRVATLIASTFGYGREILRGIYAYARPSRRAWVFYGHDHSPATLEALSNWQPQGILVYAGDPAHPRLLAPYRCPIVNVANVMDGVPWPTVTLDHHAVGRMAADYFYERGWRHLAFFGTSDHRYAQQRQEGFTQALQERGLEAHVIDDTALRQRAGLPASDGSVLRGPVAYDAIFRTVAGLPRPLGILACNDIFASRLVEALVPRGVMVPDEVAVLGVDDDDLLCQRSYPPLSSVKVPAFQIGYEAAKLLDGLMRGGQPPAQPLLLPPVGVHTRQSTDLLAINDPDVVAALRHIQAHCHEALAVADLLRVVPLSRRALEQKFRNHLGRGPMEEVTRARVERAKHLLAETNYPMDEVALRSGFNSGTRFSIVFKRLTGQTPLQHRRRFRHA